MEVSNLIFLLGCFVVIGAQQNGTHHERPEYDGFSFAYDGSTSLMCVRSGHTCYIWQLTDDEKQSIHTDDGIHQTEMRILTEIDNAYFTVVPKVILKPSIILHCGSGFSQHYYLVH